MDKRRNGAAMAYAATILADIVSLKLDVDDIELLAAFAVTFADSLALIAANMQSGNKNNEEVFFPPSLIL